MASRDVQAGLTKPVDRPLDRVLKFEAASNELAGAGLELGVETRQFFEERFDLPFPVELAERCRAPDLIATKERTKP
jgi:hypothetical protein